MLGRSCSPAAGAALSPAVGRPRGRAGVAGERLIARRTRGRGQLFGITAEAGMGKSRLAAPRSCGSPSRAWSGGYGGACQSYGTNISYLVWQSIWQAFFDIDPDAR